MKRFLVTTADERTWRIDRPILFLGEWCRLYTRRSAWEHLDAEVVPYHWDDRRQLDRDYHRLQSIYEQLLCAASAALNEHHGTGHSIRYWRTLIGPWLYTFIHVLFDRWTMVARASDCHEIEETLIADIPPAATIAHDLASAPFQDMTWNHYMFGKAIECQDRIRWRRIPAFETSALGRSCVRPTLRRAARIAVRDAISSLLGFFTRDEDAMVIRTYLPRSEELRLQWALGQVPKLWSIPRIEPALPDTARRRGFQIACNSTEAFVRFAVSMIPQQIPTVYLEGYRDLKTTAERLPWPSKPKVIFTSNLFTYCELFQEWTAAKAEAGHPFVIGQHGGFVGVANRVPGEAHMVRVADRLLTWGWRDDRPPVCPAAILTNIGKPIEKWNSSGNLLLVTNPFRLFAFRCMSTPIGASQSASFLADQLCFAGALDESIRRELTVRIQADIDARMRTSYIERWKDAFPTVDIDPSARPIERRIRRCRLFVYTYNSTGFLETLARNIPTIIFWNPSYFELRPSAQPYFDLLAGAQIYHASTESAARHVTAIWHNVADWWNSPVVQEARRTFCEQYARMPPDPLRVVKEALLSTPAPQPYRDEY